MNLTFSKWWCPPRFRPPLLRLFGAEVGTNVLIRHRVRILWPWKLRIGDNSWIGEDAWLLNLEPIHIGHDVCISQAVFLCTGSHDRRHISFDYDNSPIAVADHAWIGARATILKGVTIGRAAVIGACELVTSNVPEGALVLEKRAKRGCST